MTCELCQTRKPGGGEYNLTRACCAARILDGQIQRMCDRYGHTRAELRAAMAAIPRGKV